MALDEARGRVVMFGGLVGVPGAAADDTWEWDGVTWTLRQPATRPPARYGHALAYDRARQRIVMFGGGTDTATWEWDGIDWMRHAPANSPPVSKGHGLAYDARRERIVLYGGCVDFDPLMGVCNGPPHDELWEWDGDTWTRVSAVGAPPPRGFHAMAYDEDLGRVIVYGGALDLAAGAPALADTWEWDGTTWTERSDPSSPSARAGAAFAFDAGRGIGLLFGGGASTASGMLRLLADTWQLGADGWRSLPTELQPAARRHAAFAFDRTADRLLLFGGEGEGANGGRVADSWSWDGDRWQPLTTAHAPIARSRAACAIDGAGDAVLLVGGDVGTGFQEVPADDTWRWRAGDWNPVGIPPPTPAARAGAVMAYDRRRGRLVLFGGHANFTSKNDTWEWDGSVWSEKSPRTVPPGRADHGMAYDEARGTVIMFGGGDRITWEWDGDDWHRLAPSSAPPDRAATAMSYQAAIGEVVLFGGRDASGESLADTWLFGFRTSSGGETCTSGFDGNRNRLVGCADPDCAGTCTTCGDGQCGPLDDCHACPGDCGPCNECGDLLCDAGETLTTCPGDCHD
jgi:hypothetical protein